MDDARKGKDLILNQLVPGREMLLPVQVSKPD